MKQNFKNEITKILHSAPVVKNLARKKFVAAFVLALIQSRKVQFSALAQHLNDEVKLASNENRIEDFFREVNLDYLTLAVVLLSLLPRKAKLRICIDRTDRTADAVGFWPNTSQYLDGIGRAWGFAIALILGIIRQ